MRGKTVAVLVQTFKSDTGDMREAPSIPLVTGLLDMGAKVRAHDPVAWSRRPGLLEWSPSELAARAGL